MSRRLDMSGFSASALTPRSARAAGQVPPPGTSLCRVSSAADLPSAAGYGLCVPRGHLVALRQPSPSDDWQILCGARRSRTALSAACCRLKRPHCNPPGCAQALMEAAQQPAGPVQQPKPAAPQRAALQSIDNVAQPSDPSQPKVAPHTFAQSASPTHASSPACVHVHMHPQRPSSEPTSKACHSVWSGRGFNIRIRNHGRPSIVFYRMSFLSEWHVACIYASATNVSRDCQAAERERE